MHWPMVKKIIVTLKRSRLPKTIVTLHTQKIKPIDGSQKIKLNETLEVKS